MESGFESANIVKRSRGAMLLEKEEQTAKKEKRWEQNVSRVKPCQSRITCEPCCGRRHALKDEAECGLKWVWQIKRDVKILNTMNRSRLCRSRSSNLPRLHNEDD